MEITRDVSEPQAKLVAALNFMFSRCNGARGYDDQGFNKKDAYNQFLLDMRDKYGYKRNMTYSQMSTLLLKLSFYRQTQLDPNGYYLPTKEEVQAVFDTLPTPDKNLIDTEGDFIFFHFIYDTKTDLPSRMQLLKSDYKEKTGKAGYKKYTGKFERTQREAWSLYMKEEKRHGLERWWRFPKSDATLELIRYHFPMAELTHEAIKIAEAAERRKYASEMQAQQEDAERNTLFKSIVGDLDAPLPDGKLLFKHQKEAVIYFIEKLRVICGDQMGLGKTLEALIAAKKLQDFYNLDIFVITTKSNLTGFERAADMLGCNINCVSWGRMPIATNVYPMKPFVLIADEAHYAQNMTSQRAKNFIALSWHRNCKAVFAMTGTPAKNGRPINLYPLLLAVKHPLVFPMHEEWTPEYPLIWKKKSDEEGMLLPYAFYLKRMEYERNYCGAHEKWYGKKKVWKNDGATNLSALNIMTQYRPDRTENHVWACMLSRKKSECMDLPEKRRIMVPAEISPDAEKMWHDKLAELKQRFEDNVKRKLELFKKETLDETGREATLGELYEEEERMRSAEALNAYMMFRHASAIAKAEQTLAQTLELLDTGEKVVVFTNFRDTADWIKEQIDTALNEGKKKEEWEPSVVAIIDGDTEREDRDAYGDDFQSNNGKLRVIIGLAAAREAITLTAASYLILNDRFWTPGDNSQAEDRIHRIGSRNECVVYWPQLPRDLSDIDCKIDAIVEQKLINIEMLQFGNVVEGIDFTSNKDLEAVAAKAMRNLLENKKSKTRKAVKA